VLDDATSAALATGGGTARLTAYARSLGDMVTRMDRIEPAIVAATPGGPRDTTSPRATAALA
jgi:beta-lactamase class A